MPKVFPNGEIPAFRRTDYGHEDWLHENKIAKDTYQIGISIEPDRVCIDNDGSVANNTFCLYLTLPPSSVEARMVRYLHRSIPNLLGISLVLLLLGSPVFEASAAPQNVEELEEQLEKIEQIPEEHRQKAREHIERQLKKAREKEGGGGGDKSKDKKEGKKGDDKKKDEKKEKPQTVQRPEKPKTPPNPKELEARPTNGKLVLQFRGHPWADLIDWYSNATGRDVEWQELPSGYVNAITQREFTMEETGDLLNRKLLALGFTMLDSGDFLQIVKTEGLNPAFVPRVDPQELATMMPHSFARTSFQLHRFKADDIVKELEAMKSKHGKLTAMSAANRIQAMDTVVNLRDIYRTIDEEQTSGVHKPREFVIEFVRADIVRKKLQEMLGIQGSGSDASSGKKLSRQEMEVKMMQARMDFERQRMQAQANKGKGGAQPQSPPEKISLIVNDVKNSLIVKAPPHRMLDISDAIELLDVPPDGSVLDIQAYTLATRDPQELADMLEESGALSPTATIRVDSKTKTLLISGSKFDHFRVGELIKTVDGNARRFYNIRLRKHPAAQVAATIEKMMGQAEDTNSRSRRYYWWDDDEKDDDPNDKFRVTADVENNKLIIKANDAEYATVMDLLTQMGEVLTRSRFAMNEVLLSDIAPGVGEDELLLRVKKAFEQYAPNKVVLPPPREEPEPVEEEPAEDSTDDSDESVDLGTRTTSVQPQTRTMYTQLFVSDNEETTTITQPVSKGSVATMTPDSRAPKKKEPAPIIIERNALGKLVVRSEDAAALEMFEELMRSMSPKAEDWVSFRLKHVSASWMSFQMEKHFDDDGGGGPNYVFWDYWDYQRSQENKPGPAGLGTERKIKFIDDGVSTLIVSNASPKQLAKVKRLIAIYDVQEPANPNTGRYKKIIHIKHSKARVIQTALKEAFRDLLSNKDKEFADQNKGEENGGGSRFYGFGFGMDDDDENGGLGTGSTFDGKLSFGVDDSTNILIVTAQGKGLLATVIEMVEELDKAAVPSDDTRVVTLPPGLTRGSVKASLMKMFGDKAISKQPGQQNQQGQEGGEGQGGEGRGREGGEGRRE